MTGEVRKCLLGSGCDSWLQIQWIFGCVSSGFSHFEFRQNVFLRTVLVSGESSAGTLLHLSSKKSHQSSSVRAELIPSVFPFYLTRLWISEKKKKKIGINLLYRHFCCTLIYCGLILGNDFLLFFFSKKIQGGCGVVVGEVKDRWVWSGSEGCWMEGRNTELNAARLWFRAVPQKFRHMVAWYHPVANGDRVPFKSSILRQKAAFYRNVLELILTVPTPWEHIYSFNIVD